VTPQGITKPLVERNESAFGPRVSGGGTGAIGAKERRKVGESLHGQPTLIGNGAATEAKKKFAVHRTGTSLLPRRLWVRTYRGLPGAQAGKGAERPGRAKGWRGKGWS